MCQVSHKVLHRTLCPSSKRHPIPVLRLLISPVFYIMRYVSFSTGQISTRPVYRLGRPVPKSAWLTPRASTMSSLSMAVLFRIVS